MRLMVARGALSAACLCALVACRPSGTVDPAVATVSASAAGAYEASVAAVGERLMVGWYDTRDGQGEIYVRALGADGTPVGPEQRVTDTPSESYEVDLAAAGDQVGVLWYEKTGESGYASWLALRDTDGAEAWRVEVGPGGRIPVVTWDGDAFFCAWVVDGDGPDDPSTVWAGWWAADGSAQAAARPVALAGRTTWNLNAAAVTAGDVWLVFDAAGGDGLEELFAARVTAEAATVTQLTPVDGARSKYPDVAVRDGRVALVWHDERDGNQELYLAVGDALTPALAAGAARITDTAGNTFGAYLAWNGDRLGLGWSDETPGQAEVLFREFDAEGRARGDARRLTDNTTASLVPSVRAWRGGWALAWNEYAPSPEGAHADTARSQVAVAVVP
jgi:hypothetical protein